MSLLTDLAAIEKLANLQGVSLSDLFAWIGRNAYGVEIGLQRPVSSDTFEPQTLEELKILMGKLQDAVTALQATVAAEQTAFASIKSYVAGVPALVAAAVSEALAQVDGIDETAAAAAVDAARTTLTNDVVTTLQAIEANTKLPGGAVAVATANDTQQVTTGANTPSDTPPLINEPTAADPDGTAPLTPPVSDPLTNEQTGGNT